MKSIALLCFCAALIAPLAPCASRLNPAEKRTLQLRPAVVLISIHYQVLVRLKFDGLPYTVPLVYKETGSGFIYRPDGYIVTNEHVVEHANTKNPDAMNDLYETILRDIPGAVLGKIPEITGHAAVAADLKRINSITKEVNNLELRVTLPNGQILNGEIKIYSDPMGVYGKRGKDVAIVKIDATNLPTVPFGDSAAAHIQEPITVIGYPAAASQLGLVSPESSLIPTVTNGHISAIKVDSVGTPVIQSDAVVNRGNSGGPAFNDCGRSDWHRYLPGARLAGLNFFVPINTAMEFVNQVGVKPESSLFNKLWAAALDTYDTGNCQAAKVKLQSVLNILPNLPDALSLMQASEKCATEEGAIGRAMEGSTWMLYSAVGAVIAVTAILLIKRRSAVEQAAGAGGQAVIIDPTPRAVPAAPSIPRPPEPARPAAEPSYGSVQVTAGSQLGKKVQITKDGILVGTDPAKCQICVTEDAISHEHAWIVPVDNRVVVIDRGSTNGTYINSVDSPRVSKVGLQNGDRVYLGKKGSVVLTYFSS